MINWLLHQHIHRIVHIFHTQRRRTQERKERRRIQIFLHYLKLNLIHSGNRKHLAVVDSNENRHYVKSVVYTYIYIYPLAKSLFAENDIIQGFLLDTKQEFLLHLHSDNGEDKDLYIDLLDTFSKIIEIDLRRQNN